MTQGRILLLPLVVSAHFLPFCGAGVHDDFTERVFAQLKALYECERPALLDAESNNRAPFCPRNFDGWHCWPPTTPGSTARAPCPSSLPGHVSGSSLATRHCSDNGLWDETMANYTSCTGSSYHDPSLKVLYGIAEDVGHYVPWERSSLRGENRMWRDKIDRFKNCLRYMLQRPALHLDDNRSMCYRTWDGWTCWKDTPPGQTAYASCPRFVAGFSALRKAEKVCTLNGTWFRHPVSGNVWSNYTACVDEGDLQFRNFVNLLYVIGYTLSSAALLFSLFIFCYFRSLRCRRITVHKNLFLSFIINNLCWIVWYNHVISNPDVIERNPIWCRALHVVTQYFLLCNYLWMFCEGFYLHTLLVVAFIAEEKILTSLLLIGWGFPILPTVAYAVVRGLDTEASDMCWVEHDVWYTYILSVTVGLSIMFSFAFLVNIVRVLVTKLRVLNSPDNQRSRKAVRATIILLPLLGLHYVLTPFRPQCGGGILLVYEVISAIFTSLQGLCVAILFCFIHDEVVAALRQTYSKRLRFRTTYRTFYADTSVTFVPKRP